jgi:DNA-binding transcriptional ArsR family regulator
MIPNTTQIPNVILDHWLGELPGETLKVLLYIARRTFGFHAECASLRISQIASGLVIGDERKDNGTGLSERAVRDHLRVLAGLGLVRVIPQTRPDGGTAPSLYTINLQPEQTCEQSFPPLRSGAPP